MALSPSLWLGEVYSNKPSDHATVINTIDLIASWMMILLAFNVKGMLHGNVVQADRIVSNIHVAPYLGLVPHGRPSPGLCEARDRAIGMYLIRPLVRVVCISRIPAPRI